MGGLPDLSQLCVGHAPVPTAVKSYNSKNPHMKKSNVPGSIVHRNKWHPLPQSASALIDLKAKVFKEFDKERRGPNLYSMTKLLPILMELGFALSEYTKILPQLVQALLKTETGLGIQSTQRTTRQGQAENILKTLYRHSWTCAPPRCDAHEGQQFRNDLEQAMKQGIPNKATYDHWYGRVTS